MIIDFHTHIFPDKIAKKTITHLAANSHTKPFTDATADGLAASMQRAGIRYSINQPVMTSPEQVEKINTAMIKDREWYLSRGILPFGGMHPDYTDYKKELRRLRENGVPGIKLHPFYQRVSITDIRMKRIISCAGEEGLIVLTHAGIDISVPGIDYCPVSGILEVIREVQPQKFVLAHMGGWGEWEDVARDLAGAPVWFDTAFSIGPLTPNPETEEKPPRSWNLSDEDFVRLVRKHGTDRILFATDSPWADQADFVARIEKMDFSEAEKVQIFSGNALQLLGEQASLLK